MPRSKRYAPSWHSRSTLQHIDAHVDASNIISQFINGLNPGFYNRFLARYACHLASWLHISFRFACTGIAVLRGNCHEDFSCFDPGRNTDRDLLDCLTAADVMTLTLSHCVKRPA